MLLRLENRRILGDDDLGDDEPLPDVAVEAAPTREVTFSGMLFLLVRSESLLQRSR